MRMIRSVLLFCMVAQCISVIADTPRLLIVIPTFRNPEQFFETLDTYVQNLSGEVECSFHISCCNGDRSMQNNESLARLNSYKNLTYFFGKQTSLVESFNRDLKRCEFDMVLLANDDVRPIVHGFDKAIAQAMSEQFPDFDGVLKIVGFREDYNTTPVIGKNWYNRFGYAFHPSYKLDFHANELSIVSRMLHKEFVFDEPLVRSQKSSSSSEAKKKKSRDRNMKDMPARDDYKLFCERRAHFFGIDDKEISANCTKDWSILICTIYDRSSSFERLYNDLTAQIKRFGLEDHIEIIYYLDNRGEHTIGEKRNWLLQHSHGKYVNFIDDDDIVHEDYIKMIFEALQSNPDCVQLAGIMLRQDGSERKFVHSMKNKTCSHVNNVDHRPVTHINTMKYKIAVQAIFPEINRGEDTRWWMRLVQMDLFKIEAEIDMIYYFYWPSIFFERKGQRPKRPSHRSIARFMDNNLYNE